MAHLQIVAVLIVFLAISHAFYVPQNDGTSIRDQILSQKFSFLENIFKNTNVDVEAIKQKIKEKDVVEEIADVPVDGDAIRDDVLNKKFAFLENHLKQFNVDVNGIKDRVWTSIEEKHSLAKRDVPENGPVDGIAIRDQILDDKFAFLENLLKPFNVDVNAIKERIKASTAQHSVSKRSVSEDDSADGIAIRDQILDDKFAFLENLLKQFNVDVNAIKERIKASTAQHSVSKRSVSEDDSADGIAIRDQVLDQKFTFLENLLKQYNVDVNAIKERIKASTAQHSVSKRSVSEDGSADGIAIRDQMLDQKFEYLSNYLKHLNIDFNAIKERIKATTDTHAVSKRAVTEESGSGLLDGVIEGFIAAINTALKTVVDAILTNINKSSGGIISGEMLLNLQAFLYSLIDKAFVTTTVTYTSPVSFI